MTGFSGVLPVVPTPFAKDGLVDHESLAQVVAYAISCGIKALVYPGVASEDIQLTAAERLACLKTVTQSAKGHVQVIGGVNSIDAREMVSLAGVMKQQNVDGIMAMAVPSMKDKGFEYWFRSISEISGGLPIVLQNLFAPRGTNLGAEQMLNLARNVEAIRYIKEEVIPSGPQVTAMVDGMDDFLDGIVGGGGARYLFEELERGVIASMPAIELLELHVALMEEYAAGRRAEALRLYQRSLPLLLMQAPYRMRLTKLILKHRGIIKTDLVRETLPELDKVSKALIIELYQELNLSSGATVA